MVFNILLYKFILVFNIVNVHFWIVLLEKYETTTLNSIASVVFTLSTDTYVSVWNAGLYKCYLFSYEADT